MGGKYINQRQAKLYMRSRNEQQLTQEAAAAKIGISVRSGRNIESGRHYTCRSKQVRNYKTRKSPIDDVWESELEPMLEQNPDLQPKTLLIYLQRTHLDAQGQPIYTISIERTLQRKVAKWRALNGQAKEIMFPQTHIPGVQSLSDFTDFKQLITINGKPFPHKFYHFRLVYSKWSYLKVIQRGESMQALSEGLQEALFALGGAPKEHRTDSLSAAFKNLAAKTQQDLTDNYKELCCYYNMFPTRNNKGKGHENGSVESSHGHIKNRIRQELILRNSNDFNSIDEYEQWIHNIVKASNKRNCNDFETEQLALQPLPACKTNDYEIKSVKVTNLSIIAVKGLKYSVPNSLAGHTITLHIYQNKIKVYLGSSFIFEFKRRYLIKHGSPYVINYKHVIYALIKKPAAFRNCQYRNELLPNENYRQIWHFLDKTESKAVLAKIMLRLLKLASSYNCEESLGIYVADLIRENQLLEIEAIENRFHINKPILSSSNCEQHDLSSYDFIITKQGDYDASTRSDIAVTA